jgi:ABC-2 type transport system permease protein
MKTITIFIFELKHFWCSKFKLVALILFVVAGIYGLHNGAALYQKQSAAIDSINFKAETQKAEILDYFNKGEKGPATRPWIDVTTPFWAIWNTPIYAFKKPSSAMVYSIGQAEQYGFYKRITFWASPYDADMAQEIANPERLQTGTLDFSFVILFLLPLLLLILVYNLKASEAEQGFLPLIEVQTASKHTWLLARLGFYVVLVFLTC